jgi:hypothetical protein
MASQMQAVRIAVQASVALAVLASGAVQAAPDKELPPQPGVADVIKESTAADVPAPERSRFEVMRTESATFQKVVEAQRNRGGPWTRVAAGHVDLCAAPIPVREQK